MAIPFATAEVVTATEMNELARAHWRKTTSKQVVNTVTETDLLNSEITIDAGAMSTNRVLRLMAWGDSINNSGASRDIPRFKFKLGATTLFDAGVTGLTPWNANASRFGWRIVAEIMNLGAANSQWASLAVQFGAAISSTAGVPFTTGEGVQGAVQNNHLFETGGVASTVDTTAAQALALTVILPVANASLDVTLKCASVVVE